MNLKVNGEYLDFDDDIEIERKIKLFEDVSTTDGDVSFSFQVPGTAKNLKALSYPLADVSNKPIYAGLDCEIINFGQVVYRGLLRVENKPARGPISCSFFSGNSNWFALITGDLQDLDFSEYDENLTSANITASWANTKGMKYPLIDSGVLEGRRIAYFIREDFVPFLYVKTVFKKLFQSVGLKIQGELIEDPIYSNLLVSGNVLDSTAIEDRSTYANKTSLQTISAGAAVIISFTDDSTEPYYDGDQDNYNSTTSRYTADVGMIVDVDVSIQMTGTVLRLMIYQNGVEIFRKTSSDTFAVNIPNITLSSGDYLECYGQVALGSVDVLAGSTIKYTPTFIYKTFGNSILPAWTKQKFVSNILKMFNVITAYDEFSKTVTFNLFEKIKEKTPIDISQYITNTEINYEQFVGNYSKKNLLLYQQPSLTEINTYNKKNTYEYGTGVIDVDNQFIDEENEMIEVDFSAAYGYLNQAFGMHLEKLTINETEDVRSISVTQVNDNSGVASVQLPTDHGIEAGDLVQIKDSNVAGYNGVYVVITSNANDIECAGLDYISDADLTIVKKRVVRSGDDDVYILIDSGPQDISDFSSNNAFVIQTGIIGDIISVDEPSFGFFNMINNEFIVNDFFKSGLSFGSVNLQNSYQRTIIDNYWRLFTSVVNDPAMNLSTALLPLSVFKQIDFLSPVFIKSSETSNLWYVNRISGYKDQDRPCELELIKL